MQADFVLLFRSIQTTSKSSELQSNTTKDFVLVRQLHPFPSLIRINITSLRMNTKLLLKFSQLLLLELKSSSSRIHFLCQLLLLLQMSLRENVIGEVIDLQKSKTKRRGKRTVIQLWKKMKREARENQP